MNKVVSNTSKPVWVGLAALACACALLVAPASAFADELAIADVSNANTGSATSASPDKAMYRLYNPWSGEHFYTGDPIERNNLADIGWNDEGGGWMAPSSSKTPVYRLYNPYGADHHYTTSASERSGLIKAGWIDEGIGWYSDDEQSVPLLRQYNPYVTPELWRNNSGSHNFTTDVDENDTLVSLGWVAEGAAWYGTSYPMYVGSYVSIDIDNDIWIDTSPYYEVHVASQVGDDITMDIVSSGRNGDSLCVAVCSTTLEDGMGSFDYEDNRGNKGKGAIKFKNGLARVDITQTETVDSTATIARTQTLAGMTRSELRSKIARTPEQMKARLNLTEDIRPIFDHGYKGGVFQRYIVLHDTEGIGTPKSVLDYWESDGRYVAAHFVVGLDGSIVQSLPLDSIGHHAGYGTTGHNERYQVEDSRDDKRGTLSTIGDVADYGMNSWSIGIEMVHEQNGSYYPEEQLVAVDRLIAYINSYYGYPSEIIAHKDWRLGNTDTSPAFDGYLANYKDHGTHY